MEIIQIQQNTPEWHDYRRAHFNASDAPAMLGISPYKSREQLLKEYATGITPEIDEATQRIFDQGHALEKAARPEAETKLCEELFPVVGKLGKYSASFDGLTMDGEMIWEHKTLNQKLKAAMIEGVDYPQLPDNYRAQMEHQMIVAGCNRALFSASNKEGEIRFCFYRSDPHMRQRIINGWAQFEADLAQWQPADSPASAAAPIITAAPAPQLPAPVVQIQGALSVAGNLDIFGQALRGYIEQIPKTPATDQEFADAEAACKTLKTLEDKLKTTEEITLAQVPDLEKMRHTFAQLIGLARETRLATEKIVKAEKENRRTQLVLNARQQLSEFIAQLERQTQGLKIQCPAPDFAAAIKGKSSLDNMQNALHAALLEGKASAQAQAEHFVQVLQRLSDIPREYAGLFADRDSLAQKPLDMLDLIIQARISEHKSAQTQAVQIETPADIQKQRPAENTQPPQQQLNLSEINQRIAPFRIDAAALAELGFEAVKIGPSKYYSAAIWPQLKGMLIERLNQF